MQRREESSSSTEAAAVSLPLPTSAAVSSGDVTPVVDSGVVLPEPYTPASVIPSVEEEPLAPTPPNTPTTNQLSVADRVSKLYATKKKSKEISTGIATTQTFIPFFAVVTSTLLD